MNTGNTVIHAVFSNWMLRISRTITVNLTIVIGCILLAPMAVIRGIFEGIKMSWNQPERLK